jgi:hypothetical protein
MQGRVWSAIPNVSSQSKMALGVLWTRPDAASPVSGHFLAMCLIRWCTRVSELAIGLQRLLHLKRDTWRSSSDWMLRPDTSGHHTGRVRSVRRVPNEGVMALFVCGVINRILG